MARAINCKKCLHEKVCVGGRQESQDASCFAKMGATILRPPLNLPNEWVSVENAMPPEDEPVLCIVSGKPEAEYHAGGRLSAWIMEQG